MASKRLALALALILVPPAARTARADERPDAVEATDRLAFAMLKAHQAKPGNLFYSPLSLAAALGMAHGGASGATLGEMSRVLGLPEDAEKSAESFKQLLTSLNAMQGPKRKVELNIADAIWSNKGIEFLPDFSHRITDHFGGVSRVLDFGKSNGGPALATINKWVSDQTRGHIPQLLPAGAITPDSQVIITNAVYFLGKWNKPFTRRMTHTAPFTKADAGKVKVNMMHQEDRFGYHAEGTFAALAMPYGDTTLSMLILLPNDKAGLSKLESSLTPKQLAGIASDMQHKKVDVYLPRFKMRWKREVSDDLRQSGLEQALSDAADFSAMTTVKPLRISKVYHEATVEVDEAGTEATAATGVEMGVTSMRPDPSIVFRADHPFLFVIRDSASGAILFVGRMTDPSLQ